MRISSPPKLELCRVQDIPGLPDDIISLARLAEDDGYTFYAAPGGDMYLQHSDLEVAPIPVLIGNEIFVLDECAQSAYVKSNKNELRGESYTKDSATYLRRRCRESLLLGGRSTRRADCYTVSTRLEAISP